MGPKPGNGPQLREQLFPARRAVHALIISGAVAAFVASVAALFALIACIPVLLVQQIAVGSAGLMMAICPALAMLALVKTTRSPTIWFDYVVSVITSLGAILLLQWTFAAVVRAVSGLELSRSGSAILVVVGATCALIGSIEIWRRSA